MISLSNSRKIHSLIPEHVVIRRVWIDVLVGGSVAPQREDVGVGHGVSSGQVMDEAEGRVEGREG